MTQRTLSAAADAPVALNAFVRGIERRAAVFGELLCGDAIAGDAALAVAIRAFRGISSAAPMQEWPWRFWSLLLATPQLRRSPPPAPTRDGALQSLARLPHAARAALLLRLAGGVADADAALALGIAPATYRLALQHALPHRADGTADVDAWRAMGEAVQAVARSLPAARLAHLAQIREAALHGQPLHGQLLRPSDTAKRSTASFQPGSRPPWQTPALGLLAGLTLAALVATFYQPQPAFDADGAPHIRSVALPPPDPPASSFDARTALLSHRDLDLLLDERGDASSRDLDFHAWLAAESAARAETGLGDAAVAGSTTNVAAIPLVAQDAATASDLRDAQ